jgi:HTH-type transcriptional regulator/antitoxin HigA
MKELEYEQALVRIGELFDKQEAAMEWTKVERWEFVYLTSEVEKYEAIHYPRSLPHPIEAIKIRMRDLGWSEIDLSARSGIDWYPISEVLEGRGKLTVSMIRAFNKLLSIPLEVLIQDYD